MHVTTFCACFEAAAEEEDDDDDEEASATWTPLSPKQEGKSFIVLV